MLLFTAKSALFEALKSRAPAGTQVSFADTGQQDRRSHLWLGETADEETEPVGMRAGPRKPTAVTGSIDVHAVVVSPAGPVAAEQAVYGLREAVFTACRAVDPATVPGLLDMRPESATVETAESTDGAYSALTVRVRVRGRLT